MSTSEYPSYLDLLEKHQGRLSYEDKLSCLEWREKRNIIIERDGNLGSLFGRLRSAIAVWEVGGVRSLFQYD